MVKSANRAKTLRRAAAASVLATLMAAAGAQAADLELVKPGSLVVAYNGDMPGTGVKDGKLIGLDGEVMQAVGESLGLKVEPQLMEWAAEIESVKGRRVDAMHGMMGWNEPRTKVINITDPIYYGGAVIAQKEGSELQHRQGARRQDDRLDPGFRLDQRPEGHPGRHAAALRHQRRRDPRPAGGPHRGACSPIRPSSNTPCPRTRTGRSTWSR